ncbi:MAG: NAD(P)H-dependent oxidoreductase [Micrococcus sp.]|nr:NAD(P)H-dependent oxidoreductase [Micrococcus sp.]
MKIGIIEGSLRNGRTGAAVAAWVAERAQEHAAQLTGVETEHIVLADFDVPLLTSATVPGAAQRQYDDERVTAWGAKIDECDAFIFVTPEYNHSVPGGFKNAFDSIAPEWQDKPVAFVGYGASGGVRAVEAWRLVVSNFNMHAVRTQLEISIFRDFEDGEFIASERRAASFTGLMDQLLAAAGHTD